MSKERVVVQIADNVDSRRYAYCVNMILKDLYAEGSPLVQKYNMKLTENGNVDIEFPGDVDPEGLPENCKVK